jgi:esterase/lipase
MMGSRLRLSCLHRLYLENQRFRSDYKTHFLEGETHPPHIGKPFLLHHPTSRRGVLLIHGFMAAPHEVRPWAEHLFSQGYTVYAPRLHGHGTSARDLESRTFADWMEAVNRGDRILSLCCDSMIVAGFSTGAGLALAQAIDHPHRYKAVVAISAPMKFKGISTWLTRGLERWNSLTEAIGMTALRKPFAPNHPDNPHINYHRCPIHGFNQVKALMRHVHRKLPVLTLPALIIQGSSDPKVDPRSGPLIFNRTGSRTKHYHEIDHHQHGIVRGPVSESVFSVVDHSLSGID